MAMERRRIEWPRNGGVKQSLAKELNRRVKYSNGSVRKRAEKQRNGGECRGNGVETNGFEKEKQCEALRSNGMALSGVELSSDGEAENCTETEGRRVDKQGNETDLRSIPMRYTKY